LINAKFEWIDGDATDPIAAMLMLAPMGGVVYRDRQT
jgi:hypothetical protein